MIIAGCIDSGAFLHQGAVGIGEIDLSNYSCVVIMYGIDASYSTQDRYEANAHNRIMLTKSDSEFPNEEDIIVSATYTLEGWAVVEFMIDLTDIDYSGPIYVTWDTLPGTFMLIGSIEFIGVGESAPTVSYL